MTLINCKTLLLMMWCRSGSMDEMDSTYRQEGVSVSQNRMRIEGEEVSMKVFEASYTENNINST